MEKEKKYFKELKKKVDIYFVIIISMLSSLSIYMLYERKILNQENIYVLMAILTISFIIYIFSIRKNFISKNINELDKAIIFSNIFLITSFFMIIIIKSIKNRDLLLIYNLTKRLIQRNITISFTVIITSVIIVLTVLSCILISIRFYYFHHKNKLKENENKFYTLSDILSEPIPKSILYDDNGYIASSNIKYRLIKDNYTAGKDLFGRKLIIDNLSDSIDSSTKYSDCFTIGVVGEWGSGKSTVIKLAKKELENQSNFIIVDDFDSWAIKSQDALILAMYNTIMENLGENIGYFKRKKVQNALINISTNIPYIGKGIVNFFENNIDDYSEYKEIKADLGEKLKKSDKRLVFIIDNLDRMKSDNVIFLLTLIETLFKLPNITYIVAYDRNRLKKIFRTDKIDSKYIEKIISKEIIVPKIHNLDKQIIFYNCLKNSMPYNIKKELLEIISSKFDNIRDFIRFLNFIVYDMHNTNLDKSDFLIIRTIEFLDYNLYNKIYINKNFITIIPEHEYNFTKEQKEFFEEVKKSNFFDLLQSLSSGISNFSIFKNKQRNDSIFINRDCIEKNNYICNSYYFEHYFSFSIYTKIYQEIKTYFQGYTFIDCESIYKYFEGSFFQIKYLHSLGIYIKEIKIIKIDDKRLNHVLYILVDILKIINDFSFEKYKQDFDEEKPYMIQEEYENSDVYLKDRDGDFYNNIRIKVDLHVEKLINDYINSLKNIFKIILEFEEFVCLNKFTKKLDKIDNFKNFWNNLKDTKEENDKIIDNCISISSNEDLKSNEQVEQILKELEVLFQNNIK